jgi:hypothetical protein
MTYNYERFDTYVADGGEEAEFAAFPNRLHVGDPAPDAVLTALDSGRQERLAGRWRTRTVVIEFGSFT